MKIRASQASKVIFLLISATLAAKQESLLSASALTDLQSLSHGFYYQSAQKWTKLEPTQSSGFSTKHNYAFAGVAPGGVRLYAGSEAANQFENRRPVFGMRIDASRPEVPGRSVHDLLIIRMAKKKDHRELQVIEGGFAHMQTGINSKDVIETTLSPVADQTFTLTPKNDMTPGEYIATFRGANGLVGYEFGVK